MKIMYSRDSKSAAERVARNKEGLINEELNFPSVVRNKILWFTSKPEMDKMRFDESKKIEKLLFKLFGFGYIVTVDGFVSICLQSFRINPSQNHPVFTGELLASLKLDANS